MLFYHPGLVHTCDSSREKGHVNSKFKNTKRHGAGAMPFSGIINRLLSLYAGSYNTLLQLLGKQDG